jgi:hypothetical protein
MLVDAGCRCVILGHSERRQWFGETDEMVGRKVRAAISIAHPERSVSAAMSSAEARKAARPTAPASAEPSRSCRTPCHNENVPTRACRKLSLTERPDRCLMQGPR